jgi:chemotaxis protein CheD
MNHYLLPGDVGLDPTNSNRGWAATTLLVRSLLNRRSSIENLEAKVFGGCNSLYQENDLFKVGDRNIQMAFEVLSDFHIPVKAQHTGGNRGRKIIFNTVTGKVRMILLQKPAAVINDEINKGFNY